MILVTGATGFLGNHVARVLVKRGESVRCLVRESSRLDLLEDLTGIEKSVGDLRDRASLEKAVNRIWRTSSSNSSPNSGVTTTGVTLLA